jgi:SAM-dependent methyltransferase
MGFSKLIFTDRYSKIYDQIHSDKNYYFEALQILNIVNRLNISHNSPILDFGCGTGKHIEYLTSLGLNVHGYDINPHMLLESKLLNSGSNFYNNYSEIPKIFSFCYSLFDVLSYQIDDQTINYFFKEIINIIQKPAWILLDGWYLPGLLIDKPTSRTRKVKHLGDVITREVLVSSDNDFRVTNLNIRISSTNNDFQDFQELHSLRAYESNELIEFISNHGGKDIKFFDGSNYEKPLIDTSWRFAVLFKV